MVDSKHSHFVSYVTLAVIGKQRCTVNHCLPSIVKAIGLAAGAPLSLYYAWSKLPNMRGGWEQILPA